MGKKWRHRPEWLTRDHSGRTIVVTLDLLFNANPSGLLLGDFYAAVSIGMSISFGMLDVVNIAHPALILLGSYIVYIANIFLGFDPILAAVVMLPALHLLGMGVYQVWHLAFEGRDDQALIECWHIIFQPHKLRLGPLRRTRDRASRRGSQVDSGPPRPGARS